VLSGGGYRDHCDNGISVEGEVRDEHHASELPRVGLGDERGILQKAAIPIAYDGRDLSGPPLRRRLIHRPRKRRIRKGWKQYDIIAAEMPHAHVTYFEDEW